MFKVVNIMDPHQTILDKVKDLRRFNPLAGDNINFSYTIHLDIPGGIFDSCSDEMITRHILNSIRTVFKEPTTGS